MLCQFSKVTAFSSFGGYHVPFICTPRRVLQSEGNWHTLLSVWDVVSTRMHPLVRKHVEIPVSAVHQGPATCERGCL